MSQKVQAEVLPGLVLAIEREAVAVMRPATADIDADVVKRPGTSQVKLSLRR